MLPASSELANSSGSRSTKARPATYVRGVRMRLLEYRTEQLADLAIPVLSE